MSTLNCTLTANQCYRERKLVRNYATISTIRHCEPHLGQIGITVEDSSGMVTDQEDCAIYTASQKRTFSRNARPAKDTLKEKRFFVSIPSFPGCLLYGKTLSLLSKSLAFTNRTYLYIQEYTKCTKMISFKLIR